jgi:hypothetical protein
MKRPFIGKMIVLFFLLFAACLNVGSAEYSGKTRILVVGTIHGDHFSNPNYSFVHLFQILETFDPDAICVEIRPKDFRKVLYLSEMVASSVYGLKSDAKRDAKRTGR